MTDDGSTRRLAITGTLSAALTGLAVVGVFLIAPEDADQGIIQKIFYFHVAIAIAGAARVRRRLHLRHPLPALARRALRRGLVDLRRHRAGACPVLVVVTGSIWAKASWGTWWVWTDPRLVTFVIVLLLYAAYFVLRSSAEGERAGAVLRDLLGGGVRLGAALVLLGARGALVRPPGRLHPATGPTCPASMLVWFVVSQLAVIGGLPHDPPARARPAAHRPRPAPRQAPPRGGRREHRAQYVVAAYAVVLFALMHVRRGRRGCAPPASRARPSCWRSCVERARGRRARGVGGPPSSSRRTHERQPRRPEPAARPRQGLLPDVRRHRGPALPRGRRRARSPPRRPRSCSTTAPWCGW